MACALTCMAFWAVFRVEIPWAYAFGGAFLTALLELLPLRVDDNLAVPVITGAALQLMLP
jgi:dolichol kinase